MALRPIYCVGCGLEIYPDEHLLVYKKSAYHDHPYNCYLQERLECE